jgi:hypothetical protein
VPFSAEALARLKRRAGAAAGGAGGAPFFSTDDALTALTWRALCRMRAAQLPLEATSDERTTLLRASNFRARAAPPLAAGYCGNAVANVATSMRVRELLALPLAAVAARLRASLQAHTAEAVAQHAAWLRAVHARGGGTRPIFDERGLTFIVSSWRCEWEAAAFGDAPPLAFDHGALVPIVANFTARPRRGGGGVNVYASGARGALEVFAAAMAEEGA